MSSIPRSSAPTSHVHQDSTNSTNLNNGNLTQEIQDSQVLSYSHVAQLTNFPKKDQAIVLDAIPELSIKDYTFAVGNIINPRNIRFASRISNNRICFYLTDSSIALSLTKAKTSVNIKDHTLFIRPLITESRRVLLSNVCPIIPHEIITNKLSALGVNCTSAISFVKAGISDPGFSHILSFRRQIFISPDDVDKLPDSIQISYEDTNYWIYVSTENPVCFLCKSEGHVAKKCTNLSRPRNENSTAVPIRPTSNLEGYEQENRDPFPPLPDTDINKISFKKPLSDSSPSVSTITSCDLKNCSSSVSRPPTSSLIPSLTTNVSPSPNDPVFSPKPSKKKKKTTMDESTTSDSTDKINLMLSPVKVALLQQPNSHVLSYLELKEFLDKSTGSKDITQVASLYTSDFTALIKMLKYIYPLLPNKSIKNRITRICKKLELHVAWSTEASNLSEDDTPLDISDSDSSIALMEDLGAHHTLSGSLQQQPHDDNQTI